MLVAPEQESGDADDLVVAELDQATRSVADLRDLLLDRSSPIGDRFSGGRDLGIEPEPMLVNPEQRPGSSGSEPMLVTPEQESADADTLVVAELDRTIRPVADLTEATLTGHARPKSGAEAPESRSDPVGDLDTDTRWGADSPTSQRPTITSRLRAKLRGF